MHSREKEQAITRVHISYSLLFQYNLWFIPFYISTPSKRSQIAANGSTHCFLLLAKEYTKHPPSETNTSPNMIISAIPMSCPPFYVHAYLCSYQIPPKNPITVMIIVTIDHASICILISSLHISFTRILARK